MAGSGTYCCLRSSGNFRGRLKMVCSMQVGSLCRFRRLDDSYLTGRRHHSFRMGIALIPSLGSVMEYVRRDQRRG